IFLLDPSKKIHDARAAAEAASMDMMALHMREAANRNDVNDALQRAAVKDMQEATSRITGIRAVDLPSKPKPARLPAARKQRPTEVVVLNAQRDTFPKLTSMRKPRKKSKRG
ncbi:MAG TPA: hypothetical protein VGK87_12780, partial [Anaerolineae bacterium]